MTATQQYRPWGELGWALGLSNPKKWHFLGCLGTEERSVASLLNFHSNNLLAGVDLVRIRDTSPVDLVGEEAAISARVQTCGTMGLRPELHELTLESPLNRGTWSSGFEFTGKANVCIDISSLPKRFFFPAVRAALRSGEVRNLLVLYAKPKSYPPLAHEISGNPNQWAAMDTFGPLDPDIQGDIDKHLVINTGFVVGGLAEHLRNRSSPPRRSILIPFPADHWSSVRRSWESARLIEDSLQIPKEEGAKKAPEIYHRVGALDSSTAFDVLLGLTRGGAKPAALAPLGPKPISLAFCLLASQSEMHPVYYAQPRAYAVNYSVGYEKTYAYWVKHDGENFYMLPEIRE